MNYTYELTRISPQQLFVQVKYMAAGRIDQYRNLRTSDFTEAGLRGLAESQAGSVVAEWKKIEAALDTPELSEGATGSATYVPPATPTAQPEFDPFTEKLVEGVNAGTNTQTWTITPLTAQEQTDYLTEWRARTQVSMRQTRLALEGAGLLASIQPAIDALPEPNKTVAQIEWDNASVVDRSSPVIAGLASGLGLTDVDLDNLFKTAATL